MSALVVLVSNFLCKLYCWKLVLVWSIDAGTFGLFLKCNYIFVHRVDIFDWLLFIERMFLSSLLQFTKYFYILVKSCFLPFVLPRHRFLFGLIKASNWFFFNVFFYGFDVSRIKKKIWIFFFIYFQAKIIFEKHLASQYQTHN